MGIFVLLVLCGLGLPVPEEFLLIGGGYLASSGFLDNYIALGICFIGVMTGDFIIFTLGKRWGSGVITSRYLQRVFTLRRLVRVRKYFRAHGDKTIFVARFISGFRLAAFITAGMTGMKSRIFVLIDFLAALISVPLFFTLGFFLHDHLESLLGTVGNIQRILPVVVVISLLAYLLYRRRKH
jgi:membrane protein DedA with SNARE-associated domain